jgi:hypothetical protein
VDEEAVIKGVCGVEVRGGGGGGGGGIWLVIITTSAESALGRWELPEASGADAFDADDVSWRFLPSTARLFCFDI